MIAIIDYDAGNLKSVEKALQFLGQECVITRDFHEIEKADKVILPGVGSFGDAMSQLRKFELDKHYEKKDIFGVVVVLEDAVVSRKKVYDKVFLELERTAHLDDEEKRYNT